MTTPNSTLPTAEPAFVPPVGPTAERRNPLQLLLGVIFRPRGTFSYLRDHGGWAWLVPLVLLIVLTLISRPIAMSIQQKEMEETLAQIEEQMGDKGGNFEIGVAGPGGSPLTTDNSGKDNPAANYIFTYGLPVAQVLGGWLLCAVALLGLAWILGGRPSAGGMFRLSAWALVPFIVRIVIVTVVMVVTQHVPAQGLARAFQPTLSNPQQVEEGEGPQRQIVTFGPGGAGEFTGPSFGTLFLDSLLSNIDVYTVWALALMVVGATVIARFSWVKGIIVTALYALIALSLSTLPPMITFALSGLLGGGPVKVGP